MSERWNPMVRALLLGIILAACGQAQNTRAVAFPGTQYASVSLPSGGALSSLTQSRVEFRIYNFASQPPNQSNYPFFTDYLFCGFNQNSLVFFCRAYQGTQDYNLSHDLSGRSDVRVRTQVDYAAGTMSLEFWNGDGSGYVVKTLKFSPGGSLLVKPTLFIGGVNWVPPMNVNIAFFRWYSSAADLNSRPPGEAPLQAGNVVDYEFENGLNDISGRGLHLSMSSGSASYADAPSYPPNASVKSPKASRAATPFQVDGSSSFSSVGNGSIATYRWQKVAGPGPIEFGSPLGEKTTLTLPVFGTYTVRLGVTDGMGRTASLDFAVGAVATDDREVVIIDDPAIDFLIGPLTRSGTSPWPFFDETEMKNADLLGPVIPPSPGTSLLAGTVTVSFLSATVVGIGTQFLSDFACNGTDNIMIHYPVPGGGGATGMRAFIVQACADNVTMTISPAFNERGVVDASNVAYAKITNNDMAPWINGSNNYNYYDTVLAFYRLYYRTGLEVYRTYARTLADNWWRYPLDEGRFCAPDTRFHCSPIRVQAVMGMMMRALDGRPEMWPGIVSLINDDWDNTVGPKLGVVAENDWDFREFGYVYWFMATLAKVHPEPSMRETALQKTRDGYSQFWKIRQRDDGSWRMILDSSQGYEGAGTLPWQMAFPMKGLIALHRQTNDPEIAVTLQKAVGFVSNYGYHSPCRGLLYSVLYTQCAGGPCGTCTFQNGSTGGCTGAENCDYPPRLQMGSRTLANAIPEAYGYVYAITGNTTYLTMGDNLFSANYGGSGGGPGADGGSGNFVDLIIYGVGASGKEYGFTAGAGNAQSYLAYRQRSSASATGRSVPVSFSLIGVTNVSSVRIRVTRPSGWQSDVVCSSSPCSVAVDPRQGNHLLRKEYLSAVGKVLAAEEPVLLRVR